MKTFKVNYECMNCKLKFFDNYEKGDEIEEHFNDVSLNSHKCTHDAVCKFCKTIICPNCESKKIKILKREPI